MNNTSLLAYMSSHCVITILWWPITSIEKGSCFFNIFLSVWFHFQPVPEELQNGEGFGYVVAFRPAGATSWMKAAVTSADASRYVFRNESVPPFSPYEVKVGVYNNQGEGPYSSVITVFSAEEGK